MLPVKRVSDDFRDDLKGVFDEYTQLIRSLDANVIERCGDWENTVQRIEKLVDGINRSVKSYYEGLHGTAFSLIRNQLLGYQKMPGILDSISLHQIEKDIYLYRGRIFENNRHKEGKDMFHIPLEKRGAVKTQRYSTPGYPCLYLGTTIYACWEELQQPRFDDLMVSGFKAARDFKLFDLRIPSWEDMEGDKLRDILLRLPLIVACSVVVSHPEDNFKPEYIIPQLLIEVIIGKNREERNSKKLEELVLGVIFTSTHINNDFGYKKKVFDNIAIPALDVSGKTGFCSILASLFHITNPTCFEYEEIREEFSMDRGRIASPEEDKYIFSKMGRLESRIKEFQTEQFSYLIFSPRVISFPPEGGTASVDILSNTDWAIN